LTVREIEAGLSGEVRNSPAPGVAITVGVRQVPVSARGDRGRGPLVPAVRPVVAAAQIVHEGVSGDCDLRCPVSLELGVLDELIPSAWHHVERYVNNPIEADHGDHGPGQGRTA
jgi:hypothetical protein